MLRDTRSARGALLVAAVLGIAACGYEDAARERSLQRTDGLPTIVQPECDDTASCAAGFWVGGKGYSHSCGGVRPDLVIGEALARGRYGEVMVEMRAVRGVEPELLAAISLPGGDCDEGSAPTSPWSMLFGPASEDEPALHDAICLAATDADRFRNGCPGDG